MEERVYRPGDGTIPSISASLLEYCIWVGDGEAYAMAFGWNTDVADAEGFEMEVKSL